MKQLDSYSLATGLKITKPILEDQFFPLPFNGKYILISSGSGVPGNTYSWYRLVVDFVKQKLHDEDLKIIQCGKAEDYRVDADLDLCGKTSLYQYFWLVKNAEMVICNDTSLLHVAGTYDKKFVSLFGVSHPKTSGTSFGNPANQIYLLPPGDWKPSYNTNENPKSIDKIKPEEVIESLSRLLNINIDKPRTIRIGNDYNFHVLETVPNHIIGPDVLAGHPLNIRYDKGGTEENVIHQLRYRKCTIVTDKPLPIEPLLALKANIESIIYLITENDSPDFTKALLSNGLPHSLLSFLSPEEMTAKRLNYIDVSFVDRREKGRKIEEFQEGLKFKTNKRIFSEGKIYLSHAHREQGIISPNFNISNGEVIDTPTFWEDLEFYYLYK